MKVLIIGTSLSGKTTLIRYLRADTKLPLLEMDEELTQLNNGVFPSDQSQKLALVSQIVRNVLERESVIFFTNTDYFSINDLKNARGNNFQIFQLDTDLQNLQTRNQMRVQNENYADQSQWLKGMKEYQDLMREKGLVDKVLNADQPTESITEDLMQLLK